MKLCQALFWKSLLSVTREKKKRRELYQQLINSKDIRNSIHFFPIDFSIVLYWELPEPDSLTSRGYLTSILTILTFILP